MAKRVTAAEVKEVIPTTLEDAVVVSNMIDTANVMVTEYLVPDAMLSDAILKKVELYFAAHLVALTEEKGALTRDKLGDGDQSFANIFDAGLHSTRFGQMALSLDTSGILIGVTQPTLKAAFRIV